jgi:hypothetical protein
MVEGKLDDLVTLKPPIEERLVELLENQGLDLELEQSFP